MRLSAREPEVAVSAQSSGNKAFRTVITVIMDLFVVVAIALTARIVILFFGQLSATNWGQTVVSLTDIFVLPIGVEAVTTPYGGVFDVAAAVSVFIVLAIEWLLSVIRSR